MEKRPLELVEKYSRPGPRYTSYPTAPIWSTAFTSDDYRRVIERSNAAGRPLSLYFHLPFCESHCTFCGCNVVITKRHEVAEAYLADLAREIDLLAAWLDPKRAVVQLHLGGGTPTYCSPEQLERLGQQIHARFRVAPDAEIGVEVDPRVTTPEQLVVLRAAGFNRLSLGIQDVTPRVQAAINRIQPIAMTAALIAEGRRLGYESINTDLIYGLPHQTPENFAATVRTVIDLAPDRIALYSFAYVPWLKVHQQHIDQATLPSPSTKLQLLLNGIEQFTAAGYRYVGMDHFARASDELVRALATRTLWRNFQGYTTKSGTDLIAFGITGISDVDGVYVQNVKTIPAYGRAVSAGTAPVDHGHRLSADDAIRRTVIRELLCNNYIDWPSIARTFDIDTATYFASEMDALDPLIDDGLVRTMPTTLEVTPLGRLFVRNIAMVFDRYLRESATPQRYSQTV